MKNDSITLSVEMVVFSVVMLAFLLTGNINAQFKMAGGNSQRSGYVDAEGPLTEPDIYWERSLGVRGESGPQPIIDEEGNIYVAGSPINYKKWKFHDEKPKGVLVSYDPEGNERWRYEWSWVAEDFKQTWSQLTGPVLAKDDLILMASRFGQLRCWNRNTGELKWERMLAVNNEPVTSTPVVDKDGYIYIHVRDIPTVRKMDAETGEYMWIHRFVDYGVGNTSSPTLSHDEKTLYIGRTKRAAYIYAINTLDGTYKWAWSSEKSKGHSFAWSIPVVDDKGVIYMQDESYSYFYAVRDLGPIHRVQWAYKNEGGGGAPRIAATNKDAIFSGYRNKDGNRVIFALDKDGRELWTRIFNEGGGTGGFLATNDAVYFGEYNTGNICALDARTGETLWKKKVGKIGGSFSEGITLGKNGVIYAGVDGTEKYPDYACVVALKISE